MYACFAHRLQLAAPKLLQPISTHPVEDVEVPIVAELFLPFL